MLSLWLPAALAADPALLLVGNSYVLTNDLAAVTLAVHTLGGAGTEPGCESRATPGYTLPQHLADADGTHGDTPLRDALVTGGRTWDWVVLQDQSQVPGFPETEPDFQASLAAVPELDALVDGAGGQTVFLMTWGRRAGDELNPDLYPDYLTMQARLAEGYLRYAEAATTDTRTSWVAPVGYAWRHVYQAALDAGEDPLAADALFTRLYQPDGSHPTPLGTWMAACVLYSSTTGRRCTGLDFPDELAEADVEAIQAAADAAVFEESPELAYPWADEPGGDTGDTDDTGETADTGDTGDDGVAPAGCGCDAGGARAGGVGGAAFGVAAALRRGSTGRRGGRRPR